MASTASTETSIGRLRCSFQDTSDNDTSTDPSSCLWFRPYQGKRSSFMLDLNNASSEEESTATAPTCHTIPESPCNCFVDFVVNDGESPDNNFFFLGGFQMISSARQVEVFVTKKGSQEEETLMTCRGIPVRDKSATNGSSVSDCFKVFCVIPGGPRPVDQLRLRLLSDTNADSNSPTKLVSIQLTGRIPDRHPKQHHQQQQQPQVQTPNAQITPSSAHMMQQMMMMMASGGSPASNNNNNTFTASATPVASGSAPRNPFFSPMSASSDTQGRPPPSGGGTPYSINTVHTTPSSHSSSLNNNNNIGRSGGGTPTMGSGASPSNNHNGTNNISSEAIIAGVSFLVRSEGQAIVQLVQSEIQTSEIVVDRKLQAMEQRMQQQQHMMETMVQQQHVMMSQLQQYHHNQQQQLQWMAAMMSQPQHQEAHIEENDGVDTGIETRLASERYPESPTANDPSSSFPTESSYDPTCRVHLPDRGEAAPNTNTESPLREKKQEDSPNNDSETPPVDRSRNSPVSGLSDAGGSPKGVEGHNLPEVAQETTNNCDEAAVESEREEDEKEEKESGVDDEADVLDLQTKGNDDDDRGDDGASGLEDGSSDGNGRSEEDRGGGDFHSNKDNNAGSSDAEKNKSDNKESDAIVGSDTPEGGAKEQNNEPSNYDADDDTSEGDASDSIMQKQLVFEAPPYKFPSKISPISQSQSNNEGSTGMLETDESDFPSIEKKASMVDHLSIRYCSTEITEMPSMMSRDTTIHNTTTIDQADSIEILAVFPESPYGGAKCSDSTPSFKSPFQDNGGQLTQISSFQTGVSSPSLDGGGDIDDENPSDSSDEGYDSQDVEDLVSVSLVENIENKGPPVSILKNGMTKGTPPRRMTQSRIQEQNVFY